MMVQACLVSTMQCHREDICCMEPAELLSEGREKFATRKG